MQNGNENVSGRDAILFLPGLGERVLSQSAKDIAQKMARAIDLNAQTESATLNIQSIAPLRYGVDGNREAQAAQIVRKDGEETGNNSTNL